MSPKPQNAAHPAHYLVKSEPSVYSFAQLCRDGQTRWDGVRNYEARNNLRSMRVGDELLYYHSNEGKEIVGVARVVKAAYPDPTAPGQDWSVIDLAPVTALVRPVTLSAIKADPRLAEMALVRKSRISVVPVTAAEFALVLHLGGTKPAAHPGSPADAKPAAKSAPARAAKSANEPATKSATKPKTKSATKPKTKSATKPKTKSKNLAAPKSAHKSSAKSAAQLNKNAAPTRTIRSAAPVKRSTGAIAP